MHRLDAARIDFSRPLPGALISEEGRILAPAGKVLDATQVRQLRDEIRRGLYGRDEWSREYRLRPISQLHEDPPSDNEAGETVIARHKELVPVSVDQLQLGSELPNGLYRQDGVMLLAEGMPITSRFLARLRQQGIYEVCVPRPEENASSASAAYRSMQTRATLALDAFVESMGNVSFGRRLPNRPRPHLKLSDFHAEVERGREAYHHSVNEVGNVFLDVLHRQRKTVTAARDMVSRFLDFTKLDHALLPSIVHFEQTSEDYLYNHGVNVALLAMNAATELAYPSEEILEIGLGSLLQDVGMLQVSREVRFAPRWLTPQERKEIGRHPIYSISCLDGMDGISQTSLLISYQSHERPDTSGYPRARPQNRIHPYARLVATSDAYSALNSHRPHRNARTPYEAVNVLLREVRLGRFDGEALRIFLDGMSVFPVGSYVRLSNGQAARVLRANPGHHTQPIVVLVDDEGELSDAEIDLSHDTSVHVAEALRSKDELRLRFECTDRTGDIGSSDAVPVAVSVDS